MSDKHVRNRIAAYLHDELPADERRSFGQHILRCPRCRGEYEEIKSVMDRTSGLERAEAPDEVWLKLSETLSRPEPAPFLIRFLSLRTAAIATVLILAGLVSGVYFLSTSRPVPDSADKGPSSPGGWAVEFIGGKPASGGQLQAGETLETDEESRARVSVADIGQVELAPNTEIRLLKTDSSEHRLSLERGTMKARIFAPPRLFVVDTPSAVAVDLGCIYTLEVNDRGDSKLHVTSGFVALEHDGREQVVPAGAMCMTRKGKGLGTPFSEDAPEEFRKALDRFDFESDAAALATVLRLSKASDSITLWHLLPKVSKTDRLRVYRSLAEKVTPPPGVKLEGVMNLEKEMLDLWWQEIEKN